MRIRAVDGNNDWQFGKGQNDYKRGLTACVQNIATRLQEFLGDCFFNNGAGIDWLNLLGAKDQISLNLSISAIILNTEDVTGINQLSATLNPDTRNFQVEYEVQTVFGTTVAGIVLAA